MMIKTSPDRNRLSPLNYSPLLFINSMPSDTEQIKTRIVESLNEIEKNNDIRIIYAAEVGNRAWSLQSKSAENRDVRFVYIRNNASSYLKFDRPNAFWLDKMNGSAGFEWTGYDFECALRLAHQISPTMVDLMHSNTIYKQDLEYPMFIDNLRQLVVKQNRPAALISGYRQLAYENYEKLLKDKEHATTGDYIQVVRPLLMFEWLYLKHRSGGPDSELDHSPFVEMNINMVLEDLKASSRLSDQRASSRKGGIYDSISVLIEKLKILGKNADVGRIKPIDEWVKCIIDDGLYFVHRVKGYPKADEHSLQDFKRMFNSMLKIEWISKIAFAL